jgi:hypothetical protein
MALTADEFAKLDDEEVANLIKTTWSDLRGYIVGARARHLEVQIPALGFVWLNTGKGPGGPTDWHVKAGEL